MQPPRRPFSFPAEQNPANCLFGAFANTCRKTGLGTDALQARTNRILTLAQIRYKQSKSPIAQKHPAGFRSRKKEKAVIEEGHRPASSAQ